MEDLRSDFFRLDQDLVMVMDKFIRTHDENGVRYGNGFIVGTPSSHSFGVYREMIAEARKTFPGLSDEHVQCISVCESSISLSYPAIRFACYPDAIRNGWLSVESEWLETVRGNILIINREQ